MGVQINGSEGNVIATKGTFSGDVGIGGTLTYEDVTNIDSVGLITARSGIEIGASPGVAASISVDGNMIVSGISTFGGDVQVPDKIIHSGDTNTAIRFPAADTITAETGGSERLRIDASGDIGLGESSPNRSGYASPVVSVGYDTTNGYSVFELLGNKTSDATIANIVAYNVGGSSRLSAIAFERSGANNSGAIRFETYASGSSAERMRISKEGYVTKPNLPAFFANASPSHSNFTGYDNSVHSFGTVHYNNGSHYNNSTGRFTAPVDGFYWFSAGIWSANSDESSGTYLLVLTRNDSDASNELQFAGCNHRYEKVQLTVSGGINMTAGQTVRLWHNGSRISSTPRNYFSGYLVG